MYELICYNPDNNQTIHGKGDSGGLLMVAKEVNGEVDVRYDQFPTIGDIVRVGSMYARSFSYQDYWTTTPVIEIIEQDEKHMKFKTKNSYYKLRRM